jgi:hypothetical protein
MPKLRLLVGLLALTLPVTGCGFVGELLSKKSDSKQSSADDEEEEEDDSPSDKPKKKKKKDKTLADTGFRPDRDGFAFQNQGGEYPRQPPILNENVMVKMFGDKACVDGDTKDCTLTLPAAEWAHMVNKAMNGGRCEGMAVAALTFWKGIDKPESVWSMTNSTLEKKEATPFIAYYWTYQMVDPVRTETMLARRKSTPSSVADQLVKMFKAGELSTLAFWNPRGRGGHAVTPYAVEDQGNGIQHIKVYDNNFPSKERIIVIDRNADTWRYDLAALNPDQPKMPWYGDATLRNLVVIPLDLRLKKAACPFCRDASGARTVWPRASAVSIADQEGRKVGLDGDKIVNEIPDAQVVDVSAYLEGGAAMDPIFILPEGNDYDITIEKNDAAASSDDDGVAIFTAGTAVTVEGVKLAKGEKDTLSLSRETGGLRYKSGTGKVPALKMAVDDADEGVAVRVANLETDADSEVELKFDRKTRKATVQGGGKATKSYDLEMSHVGKGQRGVEKTEQRGVKFKLGESHAIDGKRAIARPKAGAKPAPPRITRGVAPRRPIAIDKDKDKDKDVKRPDAKDPKDPKVVRLPVKREPVKPPPTPKEPRRAPMPRKR